MAEEVHSPEVVLVVTKHPTVVVQAVDPKADAAGVAPAGPRKTAGVAGEKRDCIGFAQGCKMPSERDNARAGVVVGCIDCSFHDGVGVDCTRLRERRRCHCRSVGVTCRFVDFGLWMEGTAE